MNSKLNKTDWLIIGIMVFIYGILSFIRLGDTIVPQTYKTFEYANEEVIVSLKEKSNINKIRYYTGYNLGRINVLASLDGINYEYVDSIEIEEVFSWKDLYVDVNAKYISFVSEVDNSTLGDILLYDNNGNQIPMIIDVDNPLTDEIKLVPREISYMNSTYFDEIYYARTVYEYINGIDCYEWTHPPLGKLIMAIPVLIFGFSPFTYRLMGNLFGILLIPIMYILGKKLFKSSKWATLAALIMMFDNFHFAHTRIALIDGFQVVFILLSVLFMKKYLDLRKNDNFKKKTKYLLLSGLFIGCAIATKWNALYAGLGLAITFFIGLLRDYDVNVIKYIKKWFNLHKLIMILAAMVSGPFVLFILFSLINKNVGIIMVTIYYSVLTIYLLFRLFKFIFKDKYLTKLMIVCIISFIIIPIVIYILSYIIFPNISYYDGTIKGIIDMNKMMYDYHANLSDTHPFTSLWYEWPIMYKPVWLYTGNSLSNLKMTITDIGNPVVWWSGVISVIYLIISVIKKNKVNSLILIFILSTFIPYIFVGRVMFMYHYFITLPFIMLSITAFIKWITEKLKNNIVYYGYIILVIIMFIIFYPIVSGLPVSESYIESLKWFSSWYF